MSANDSTRPVGGNGWITVVTLDGSDDVVNVVVGTTEIYIHEIVASMTSGATNAAVVPFTVERILPNLDIIAAGTLMKNVPAVTFTPNVQSLGLRFRAGTISNSGIGRIYVKWSFRGGTAPTAV